MKKAKKATKSKRKEVEVTNSIGGFFFFCFGSLLFGHWETEPNIFFIKLSIKH
jgi:hypothetical protein